MTLLIILAFHFVGIAQPAPFSGTLLFNLTEKEKAGRYLTIEDFKSEKVRVLSYSESSELKYDTTKQAFSFTTIGFEQKDFAIIYKNDTTFIAYPSLRFLDAVFIKSPIKLNDGNFSFANKHIYDAIHSNKYYYDFRIFYLCQGCFMSSNYTMPKETKERIEKYIKYSIELKE